MTNLSCSVRRRFRTPVCTRAVAWRCVVLLACAMWAFSAAAERTVLRFGTGGDAGTYFPVGSAIARAFDQHRGPDGSALLTLPQRSNGSVANVHDLSNGLLELGLSQADVAYWAHTGKGPFRGGPLTGLRAIATLYGESVHLVTRRGSGINSVRDLRGRRVSLDEPGSGTLANVRLILDAFSLSGSDLDVVHLKPEDAAEHILTGELDAYFVVAGYPALAVTELVAQGAARLAPIDGAPVEKLLARRQFFIRDTIPSGTYMNTPDVATLSVGAQLLVNEGVSSEVVYRLTSSLWHPDAAELLSASHPIAQRINVTDSLEGLATPLHDGARRYYEEIGMRASASLSVGVHPLPSHLNRQ